MHENRSEDDGSAISVRAVNYESMIIFSLSSLNYAVCGVICALWNLEILWKSFYFLLSSSVSIVVWIVVLLYDYTLAIYGP